ncbi:MAG: hypothetical protein J7L72_08845 [Candidatus Aminicenantes bacterium]|nr:hypothetical protein [Candidatus Aminicenantes bacterium]HHF52269.1 hypothetical protein [Candidatus Aminicenantes bacterium]
METASALTTSQPNEEECFSLSLTAHVQGCDAEGIKFMEKTSICEISSEKAVFELKTRVLIGTILKLSLFVPKTLILGHPLILIVTGEVIKAEKDSKKKNKQNVFLKLTRNFDIQKLI